MAASFQIGSFDRKFATAFPQWFLTVRLKNHGAERLWTKPLMRNLSILFAACGIAALLASPKPATAGPAMNEAAKADAVKPESARPDAATPPLASHKAIYELRLLEGAGTKAPASASGRIAFDFSSACEG